MVFKTIAHSVLIKGTDLLIPIALIPLLIARLGPEIVGEIGFYTSIGFFLSPVIQYGLMQNGIQLYLDSRNNKNECDFISVIISLNLFVFLALLVFTIAYLLFFEGKLFSLLVLWYVIFNCVQPTWYFQSIQNVSVVSTLNFFTKLVFFVLTLIFVHNPEDVDWYCFLLFLSSFILFAYQYFILISNHALKIPKRTAIFQFLKDNFPAFKIQLAPNAYNNFSIFFLYYWIPAKEYGLFIAAQRITEAVYNVGVIFVNSFIPQIFKDKSKRKNLLNFLHLLSFGVVCSAVSLWFLGSHFNLPFEVSFYYSFLIVPLIFSNYVYYLSAAVLSIDGKLIVASNIMIWVSLVGFIVAFITVPLFGFFGVVCTLSICRILLIFFYKIRCNNEV